MDSDEMMFEIISRLPLKAFDSIRATSKKLNSLTYDPYLFELHKKRNNIVSGFLVQNMTKNSYINEFVPSPHSTITDLKFLPRETCIVATNEQGIVVFEVPHPRHHGMVLYHICKPATKQVLALPNKKKRFQTAMVAVVTIESNPLHYKILRLSNPKISPVEPPFTHNCEIFDSKEWAWKWLPPSMLPGDVNIPVNGQPIMTSGSIYMLLLLNGDILKFDTYSEKQTTFSPPPGYHPDIHKDVTKLVKYERKLGFAFQPRPNEYRWQIWVRNTNINKTWEKLYVLNQNNEDTKIRGSLESFYDSDTCILKEYGDTLVFYKFRSDNMDIIKKINNVHNIDQIFFLRSDIETAKLKGRVKPWIAEQWQSFLPRRVIKMFPLKLYQKIYKCLFKKVLFGLKNLFKTVTKGVRREERRSMFIKLDQWDDMY